MRRLIYLVVLLCAAAAVPALHAGYGTGDPRLEKLYSTFIAPCCWRENLTVHDSQAAEDLRSRIDTLVAAGQTDDQIKAALVSDYGLRILALPEGSPRVWLFWTPFVVGAAGLALLLVVLRGVKLRSGNLAPAGVPVDLPEGWDAED